MTDKHYKTLGLHPGATLPVVKKAFRRLAKKYHPDLNQSPDAENKFMEVEEAYQFLSDYLEGRISIGDIANRKQTDWYKRQKKNFEQKKAEQYKDFVNNHEEGEDFHQYWNRKYRDKYRSRSYKHAKMNYRDYEKEVAFNSVWGYISWRIGGCLVMFLAAAIVSLTLFAFFGSNGFIFGSLIFVPIMAAGTGWLDTLRYKYLKKKSKKQNQ